MNMYKARTKQGGVVLIVSLIFLLLLAILATTVSETNLLQLQMAGNDEAKMEVTQRALAIVDAILDDTDNIPVVGNIGYKVCDKNNSATRPAACDELEIAVSPLLLDSAAEIKYSVERVGPLEVPVPFLDESIAGSATAVKVARQQITVIFDRTDEKRGAVELVQGYLRLIVSTGAVTSGG